jgi:hypothetical protein
MLVVKMYAPTKICVNGCVNGIVPIMASWEYWSPLERLLCDVWGDPTERAADKLIERGWAPSENRAAIAELLMEHRDARGGEDDYTSYCDCGKWIEHGYYEMPDHQSKVLQDSGLLAPDEPWFQ